MILLQWCYFAITSFLTGFALLRPFQKKNGYRFFGVTSYMMAGLAALNVYAEYYSLFNGVGIMANLLVMVFDLAAFWILRKQIGSFLREKRQENGPGRLAPARERPRPAGAVCFSHAAAGLRFFPGIYAL